jgi:hypothetical protein
MRSERLGCLRRVSRDQGAHLSMLGALRLRPRAVSLHLVARISRTQETHLSNPRDASLEPKRRISRTQETHLSNPRDASLEPKRCSVAVSETHPSNPRDASLESRRRNSRTQKMFRCGVRGASLQPKRYSGEARRRAAKPAKPQERRRVYPVSTTWRWLVGLLHKTPSVGGLAALTLGVSDAQVRPLPLGEALRRLARDGLAQHVDQLAHAVLPELVGRAVGDQHARHARDLLALFEPVLSQGRPGFDEIDDKI